MTNATANITIETTAEAPRRSWKAVVRRIFELWDEQYSQVPYKPL